MNTPPRNTTDPRLAHYRFMVSLKAAIPLLAFQALFLWDPAQASIGLYFAYHAMPALGPLLVMLMWVCCCYFEWSSRAATHEVHTFPSFCAAGALLLAGFYFSARFVDPYIGGIGWMLVVFGVFQLMGRCTLGYSRPAPPA
jgi:hypothetical protein